MKKFLLQKPLTSLFVIFGGIALLIFFHVISYRHTLKVIFMDVGQGDAILIQTPSGKNILIDTGPSNDLGEKISKYISDSRRVIDLLVLTHPDLDHIGGTLSVLQEFEVKEFMHSGLLAGVPMYSVIADTISCQEILVHEAEAGKRITIEPGVFIDIYSPHQGIESFDANDYSIISHLYYGNTSVLMTGDATKIIESDLVQIYGNNLSAEILKIGHHGSQTSTLDSFVHQVDPNYGIISAACDNRFGHPHPNVLSTLFKNRVEILDTCSQGNIIFESNAQAWRRL